MGRHPGADVLIADLRADTFSEAVTIVNRGQVDQPLTGWALASLHGSEVFLFPEGTVLAPGRQLRVLSGEQAQPASTEELLWTRQNVWSNRSDTVLLFDDRGREVSRRSYPRPEIREERRPEPKILVQEIDGYHLYDQDQFIPPENIRELGL